MSLPATLQDLDRASASLCLEVEKHFLEKLVQLQDKTFLLALSGGADSTALALICSWLAPRHGWKLHGIYVNHHLRAEACEEAKFVRALCAALKINYIYDEVDVRKFADAHKTGLEDAGRICRYDLLEKIRTHLSADYILVAHHAGDLSEDILLRLIRGTGWPALGGMRSLNGYIFRPLLHIVRERLLAMLDFYDQEWCEDLSNQDMVYRRNRLRKKVLPMLRQENPSLEKSFQKLHLLSLEDESFWQQYLEDFLRKNPYEQIRIQEGEGLRLPAKALYGLPKAARLRLFHYLVTKLKNMSPFASALHIQFEKIVALDRAIMQKSGNKLVQFQGRTFARYDKKHIYFIVMYPESEK